MEGVNMFDTFGEFDSAEEINKAAATTLPLPPMWLPPLAQIHILSSPQPWPP